MLTIKNKTAGMTLEGNRVQSPSFVQFYNLSKVWQSMSHAEHFKK